MISLYGGMSDDGRYGGHGPLSTASFNHLNVSVSVCLSACLFVCLFVCLSVCPFETTTSADRLSLARTVWGELQNTPPQCSGEVLKSHRKRRVSPKIHRKPYFFSGRASAGLFGLPVTFREPLISTRKYIISLESFRWGHVFHREKESR